MDGGAQPPEHRITCLSPLTKSGGDEQLRLEVDGKTVEVKLRISKLHAQLVAGIADRSLDLLEIASVVYGADAAVSRGGSADQQMGAKWHRRFKVEMPVRDVEFWSGANVKEQLEATLMFLSGDRFDFEFAPKTDDEAERTRFFKFGSESAWRPTRVLMFSGGLDSFAGALEEIADHGQRLALVSHYSATKIAPAQRRLQEALSKKFGPDCCRHVPVQVQMTKGGMKEGTHRSRSFLFAALGAIVAKAYGLSRVSFFENGVVSLNLPPVGNVLGTRATRTTHPQSLLRFTEFLGTVFEPELKIDNPFFFRTKRDVVETIARLNMAGEIANTRSCADVHNQTTQHPHCGRCSQCIDRRFAILSAALGPFDPKEAYKFDLLEDPRSGAVDREVALSYLRNAQAFEHMRSSELERYFPTVSAVLRSLGHPADTALGLITELLNRHGGGVVSVLRDAPDRRPAAYYPDGSLPRLYGDMQREAVLPEIPMASAPEHFEPLLVAYDERRRFVEIGGAVTLKTNASADVVIKLAKVWLQGAGEGLDPFDYPFLAARELAGHLGLSDDEAVRRRILRARNLLRDHFRSAGLDPDIGAALLENVQWQGYRLNPELVTVRRAKEPK